MRKPTKKFIAIAAVTGVLLAGAGVAYAYWTAGGSGTGTAETGTSEVVTVNQVSVISDLRPGGVAQELSGTFDNPNDTPVYVTSVTVSISSVTGGDGACTAADYVLTGATMAVGAEIAAGNGVGAWSGATIAFDNDPLVNQDGCKNATVNLTYSVL